MPVNLYDLDADELASLLAGWGEPRFRARQLWGWLYGKKAAAFPDMHTLPASLRARLDAETTLGSLELAAEVRSADGETIKFAFRLHDGQLIETVLMSYDERDTACLSTQAGCAMGCVFCATGQMGFARDLTAGEIIAQAVAIARLLESRGDRLSYVVLMGMGEPFHNYDAVIRAIRMLIAEDGLAIGQRHITVSTVGLVPEIRRFAREGLQVRLAISLHAADDAARSSLLPINRRFPLSELLGAVKEYTAITGRRVTFEIALIAGQNDSPAHADAFIPLLSGLLCHVNLIPINPTAGFSGLRPGDGAMRAFAARLESAGIPTTNRLRRGIDIQAG